MHVFRGGTDPENQGPDAHTLCCPNMSVLLLASPMLLLVCETSFLHDKLQGFKMKREGHELS